MAHGMYEFLFFLGSSRFREWATIFTSPIYGIRSYMPQRMRILQDRL